MCRNRPALRQPTGPDATVLDRKSSRPSRQPDTIGPGGGTLSRRYALCLHRNAPVWRCVYGWTNTPPDPHTRLRIDSECTTGHPHPIDTVAPQSGGRERDRDTRPDATPTDQPDRLDRIDTSRPADQSTGNVLIRNGESRARSALLRPDRPAVRAHPERRKPAPSAMPGSLGDPAPDPPSREADPPFSARARRPEEPTQRTLLSPG